ncbi:MAG: hypothetical protein U0744_18020 [Gemmataceae bacterium]
MPLVLLNLGSFFFGGIRSTGAFARLFVSVVMVVVTHVMRIVPIYASVVGPIILWNTADFARRRTTEREPILQPSVWLLAAFLLLLGIAFAWPGFLHGQIGNYRLGQRRFDLAIYADPSLQDAAHGRKKRRKRTKVSIFTTTSPTSWLGSLKRPRRIGMAGWRCPPGRMGTCSRSISRSRPNGTVVATRSRLAEPIR